MDTYLVYTGTSIHPCNIKYRVGSFRSIDKSRAIEGWYIIHNLIPEHELFIGKYDKEYKIWDVATSKIVGYMKTETILDPIDEILRRLSTLTVTEEKYIDILNDRDDPVPYVRPPRSNTPKVKATKTVEIDGKTYNFTVFHKRITGLYTSVPYKEQKDYVVERRPGYRTVFDYFPGKEFITRYEDHRYTVSDPETGLRIFDIGYRLRNIQAALDKFMEEDVLCILSHFPEGNASYDEKTNRYIEESTERYGKSLTEAINEFLENEYKQQKESSNV